MKQAYRIIHNDPWHICKLPEETIDGNDPKCHAYASRPCFSKDDCLRYIEDIGGEYVEEELVGQYMYQWSVS